MERVSSTDNVRSLTKPSECLGKTRDCLERSMIEVMFAVQIGSWGSEAGTGSRDHRAYAKLGQRRSC